MADDEKPKEGDRKYDRYSGLTGGLILILFGILFLLATRHYIHWYDWWAYFLLGLGAIFILDFIVRSVTARGQQVQNGKLVAGAILMAIGAAHIFGMVSWWPLILIVVGLVLLLGSLKKSSA
jgi:hypothetical protein